MDDLTILRAIGRMLILVARASTCQDFVAESFIAKEVARRSQHGRVNEGLRLHCCCYILRSLLERAARKSYTRCDFVDAEQHN
jgi:hypothetical protein